MKKRKYKLRKLGNTTISILIILLCSIVILFLLKNVILKSNLKNPIHADNDVVNRKEKKINYDDVLKGFTFEGEKLSDKRLGSDYASVLCKDNDKYNSYLINLKDKKIININELIKSGEKDNFYNKINDLLLLKFPKIIVDKLNKENAIYAFLDNYMMIYFDKPEGINLDKDYSLKVYYKEIKDYLVFDIETTDSYLNESGYDYYDSSKITIAFSFDDGPNGAKTQKLIEALEDYKMSATFFMVGNKLTNHAETVKLVDQSHSEIGYHSYRHAYLTKQTVAEINNELNESNEILKSITGKEFKLIRPPYGSYNENTLKTINMPFILWNLDTNDWKYKDVSYIKNYVLKNYRDGAIILFHDSYETSITAATELLKELYLKDVQVVNVSKLAELKGIKLEKNTAYRSLG